MDFIVIYLSAKSKFLFSKIIFTPIGKSRKVQHYINNNFCSLRGVWVDSQLSDTLFGQYNFFEPHTKFVERQSWVSRAARLIYGRVTCLYEGHSDFPKNLEVCNSHWLILDWGNGKYGLTNLTFTNFIFL